MPRLLVQRHNLLSESRLGRQLVQLLTKHETPQETPRPTATLHHDILAIVVDYLYHASPQSIQSISWTSRDLHRLAQRYLYRKLRFTFSRCWNDRNRQLLDRLQDDPLLRSFVQEIYVNWIAGANPRFETEEGTQLVNQFVEIIPQLPALRRFIWDAQCGVLPRILCRDDHRLFEDARCQLYTVCPYRSSVDTSLRNLQQCPQLTALDVSIGDSQTIAMTQLRRVLPTCENLQKLSVTCFPDHFFVSFATGQSLLEPGVRLPRLRYLQLRGLQLTELSSGTWDPQCVMWESLEYLELPDTIFLQILAPPLKNLVSLTLSEPVPELIEHRPVMGSLIYNLPHLEHLVLNGQLLSMFRDYVLEIKGMALRTLKLHDDVKPDDSIRCVPDREYISLLGRSCTALETFAIDMKVEEAWPWETFTTIAESLWYIVHLELDLEMPSSVRPTSNQPVSPTKLTLSTVREIWNFFWNRISRARHELNHLVSRPRLRTLKLTPSTRDYVDQVSFEARLSERDDLAANGQADIVCLELEGLYEKYGHGKTENEDRERFRRDLVSQAEEGPSNQKQIKMKAVGGSVINYQARPLETTLTKMAAW
ncbi:MAG: hypothetical protein L6R36_001318 [Xanthoria steineri]|nr:MAG: hypothetical protein L6R36_001318 [Xanthoria steineri]